MQGAWLSAIGRGQFLPSLTRNTLGPPAAKSLRGILRLLWPRPRTRVPWPVVGTFLQLFLRQQLGVIPSPVPAPPPPKAYCFCLPVQISQGQTEYNSQPPLLKTYQYRDHPRLSSPSRTCYLPATPPPGLSGHGPEFSAPGPTREHLPPWGGFCLFKDISPTLV